MKLTSTSWVNGDRIPARCAAGRIAPGGGVEFSDNLNPHLAWSELPAGCRSLVLLCHDFDVPSRPDDVNRPDREIPADLPRVDFFHWAMVDIPPVPSEIAEGEYSQGFTARGKPGPQTLRGARHGVNDYTAWFAGDAQMGGEYYGYDGPYPPFNDLRVHRYFFRLFALDVAILDLPERFTAADVERAMQGHVLAEAAIHGTYSLNPARRGLDA